MNCFLEDGSIPYVKDLNNVQEEIMNIPDKVESKIGKIHTRR